MVVFYHKTIQLQSSATQIQLTIRILLLLRNKLRLLECTLGPASLTRSSVNTSARIWRVDVFPPGRRLNWHHCLKILDRMSTAYYEHICSLKTGPSVSLQRSKSYRMPTKSEALLTLTFWSVLIPGVNYTWSRLQRVKRCKRSCSL